MGLFWLGWTSYSSIHPAVPMIGGFLFGTGYQLVMFSLLNYLTDVYKQFAAPAHTGGTFTRAMAGMVLPMATPALFGNLGIHWANSLLGFLGVAMIAIPFAFVQFRVYIRQKSPYCQQLLHTTRVHSNSPTVQTATAVLSDDKKLRHGDGTGRPKVETQVTVV